MKHLENIYVLILCIMMIGIVLVFLLDDLIALF